MTAPFQIIRKDGLVHIPRGVDDAFKKALLAGVPPVLREKMRMALADVPTAGARAHSIRYFGDELPAIVEQINPLMQQLDFTLTKAFNMPGLFNWLDATGLGNHYALIKVFKAWSEMKVTKQ